MKGVRIEIAKNPVEIEDEVQDFERTILEPCRSLNINIVGIVGNEGSGKTNLAVELYSRKCFSVERCSFLFNMKDAHAKHLIQKSQRKLLKDLRLEDAPCCSLEEGRSVLSNLLKHVPALIVLDDVDNEDQLDNLLPAKETLATGSLIIVTSSRVDVLTCWGISFIYRMRMAKVKQSKEWFRGHSLSHLLQRERFEGPVGNFRNAFNELPEQLYGRSKSYFGNRLQKLARILPQDTRLSLKIGYDLIIQEAVLDIACFLIGEKKSVGIALWDGHGCSGEHIMETLVNKGYVELDYQNRIRMHDELRDLGRDVAAKHSPYRLWLTGQITNIQTSSQEKQLIRGIMAATTQFASCPAHREFPKCSSHYQPPFQECMDLVRNSRMEPSLRLLVVTGNDFTEEFAPLSKGLVWLRWFNFKHTNLPPWLSMKELRILELYGASSLKELWKDNEYPPFELRELIITASWGSCFQRFPASISHLKHLKKIALIGYLGEEFGITTLPEEFCDLQSLEHLELRFCKKLSSLPTRFGSLTNLGHIDLCSCQDLLMLPDSFKKLGRIEYLDLSGCRKLTVMPDILENMTNLQKLNFSGCRKLFELPRHITYQASMRELHLQDTRLRDMPNDIGQLSELESLSIGSPLLTSLQASLGDLCTLTCLLIIDCYSLESLPECLGRLNQLQNLSLENLPEVTSLPVGLWQLSNLQTLEISGCPICEFNLEDRKTSYLPNLKVLNISETSLFRISISQECCPCLETLQLKQNDNLEEIETLPTTVKSLEWSECKNLKKINGTYLRSGEP
ncbi:disease resistance protein Roq1-like [Cryptomeria japonica]|uniref:disease resistance protein Roq1-like n=1 Tax=Cryptomeria japonica TaxID=3369 RepID=UPI0027D9EDEA|nr:disease resistance protein Roq1-like [Cryptomeria japonica]